MIAVLKSDNALDVNEATEVQWAFSLDRCLYSSTIHTHAGKATHVYMHGQWMYPMQQYPHLKITCFPAIQTLPIIS